MNKAKKSTFLDRIRRAWRAFCGKPASSLTFGLELKYCDACEYRKRCKEMEGEE